MVGPGLLLVAGLLAASPAAAQEREQAAAGIRRAIRDASRALQAGNGPLFMASFDRASFAGYGTMRDQVLALTAQRRIASSVESGPPSRQGVEWIVRVDWLLELTPKLDPGPLERRHEQLEVRMARRRNRWKITGLAPAVFFRAVR